MDDITADMLLDNFNRDMKGTAMTFSVVMYKEGENNWRGVGEFTSGYSINPEEGWVFKKFETQTYDVDPNSATATMMMAFMNELRDPEFIKELYLNAKNKSNLETTS